MLKLPTRISKAGTALGFVGGVTSRLALAGFLIGIFTVVAGMTPGQLFAAWLVQLPAWTDTSQFRLAVIIIGLLLGAASLRFNRWSGKQKAVDHLAEDLSWSIHNLLNRSPPVRNASDVATWRRDYDDWCGKVSDTLGNRAFFTRADQLHFDRLGFVETTPMAMAFNSEHANLLGQLALKYERLRKVINWTQQRR